MKAGWEVRPLGDVCAFQRGLTYSKNDEVDSGGTSVLRANNVNLETGQLDLSEIRFIRSEVVVPASKMVEPGTLLICTASGSKKHLGKTALIDRPMAFAFGGFMGLLKPHKSLLPEYLQWLMRSDGYWKFIGALSDGANINNLKFSQISEFPIPLPPLEEQRRIVAILDEAFEGLNRARANAEANLASARELFGGVLGAAFSQVESTDKVRTIGELVDKGWLARPQDGNHGEIHPKKADFVPTGVPFIMASDLREGRVDQENCYFITPEQAGSLRVGFAKDGDILLSHKGTIGRAAMLDTPLKYVMLTPQVTYYRVIDGKAILREYLYYCFLSAPFQEQIINSAKDGATRAYIGIKKQLDLAIPVPPIGIQRRLTELFRQLEAEMPAMQSNLRANVKELDALRQSILHKAFAGELT